MKAPRTTRTAARPAPAAMDHALAPVRPAPAAPAGLGHDFGRVSVGAAPANGTGPIQAQSLGDRVRRCFGRLCGTTDGDEAQPAPVEESHPLIQQPQQAAPDPVHPAERAMIDAWHDQIVPHIRPKGKRGPLDFEDLQHIRANHRTWGLRTVGSDEAAQKEREDEGGTGDAYALDPGDLSAHQTPDQQQGAAREYGAKLRNSISLAMNNALAGKIRRGHETEDYPAAFRGNAPHFSLVDMKTPVRERGYEGTLDKFGRRAFTQAKPGYFSVNPENIRDRLAAAAGQGSRPPVRPEAPPAQEERKSDGRDEEESGLEEIDLR